MGYGYVQDMHSAYLNVFFLIIHTIHTCNLRYVQICTCRTADVWEKFSHRIFLKASLRKMWWPLRRKPRFLRKLWPGYTFREDKRVNLLWLMIIMRKAGYYLCPWNLIPRTALKWLDFSVHRMQIRDINYLLRQSGHQNAWPKYSENIWRIKKGSATSASSLPQPDFPFWRGV